MAHETLFAHDYNGFLRQLRSFLTDSPRVNRANDHDDINNLGVAYELAAAGGPRPAGDILHVAAEVATPRTTHRGTVVVGTAAGGSYQSVIQNTVTFNTAARTITDDGGGDWSTAGVVVGDLIRIENAATAGNNGVFRVLSITNGGATNDVITLNTLDTLAASDSADAIDVYPITGGSIFDVREDQPGGNNFIGWMMSSIEFMANDGSIWLYMRDGGSWAVNDYTEFTLERGAFSLHDNLDRQATVDMNENGAGADTITRNDYNGNFIRDGLVDGELVEVIGSTEDGVYTITALTAKTVTLNIGDFTADDLGVEVTLIPRKSVVVHFDDADLGHSNKPTVIRTTGSWVTDGYQAGGLIEIADAVTGSNNGFFEIESIATDTIANDTLILVDAVTDGTSDTITHTPRNSILGKWTEHRYRWSATSGLTGGAANSLDSGELPPIPDANGNYTSEWVGIAPGDDPSNDPQTIYCGWQTQFSGSSVQNVEMRCFDAVSDSSFNSLGNASPPTYIYLTLSPSMELFMTGDGSHVTGFMDVNTSVAEWFYQGFGRVHGSQDQHPRPMFNGGISFSPTLDRTSSGTALEFFPNGVADDDATTTAIDPPDCSCWHRWVDGQWFPVRNRHRDNAGNTEGNNDTNTNMMTWPYHIGASFPTFPFDGGLQNFQLFNDANHPNGRANFYDGLRATPTTITPNPNREYPLIPVTAVMVNPDYNIVADFRNIYMTPGTGQATKNRILQGGFTYIVGQNHEKTGQLDFAALRLD
jgi:hypothetical protein